RYRDERARAGSRSGTAHADTGAAERARSPADLLLLVGRPELGGAFLEEGPAGCRVCASCRVADLVTPRLRTNIGLLEGGSCCLEEGPARRFRRGRHEFREVYRAFKGVRPGGANTGPAPRQSANHA